MNYLECLPNDILYIIYEKKHRLEYPSVMRELKEARRYSRYNLWKDRSKVRVGDGVKVSSHLALADKLYVVIWKGKKFLDLYDYNNGNKIRVNYHNYRIRPSTIDYIIREIDEEHRKYKYKY